MSLLGVVRLLSLGWLLVAGVVAWTFRRARVLPWVSLWPATLPTLSVLVPARDDAEPLRTYLSSLLSQSYPHLQVIVVDDRSTDDTPLVLEAMQICHPQLEVVRVEELPPGWLGKCHALHQGSLKATGEWLLFMDADVFLGPGALCKAVSAAVRREVDHLTCFPRLVLDSVFEQLFVAYFHVAFGFRYLPGHVGWNTPYIYAGTGVFNLIRADVYRSIGGHESLRLEVVDDMELGRRVKRAGYRQVFFAGYELVRVRWFQGLRGLLKGLEKNAFAAHGYRVWLTVGAIALTLAVCLAPLGLMARGDLAGWIPWLMVSGLCLRSRNCVGHAAWACWLWPLGGLLMALAIAYSMGWTLWRGGVRWRDTFYTLDELRSQGAGCP